MKKFLCLALCLLAMTFTLMSCENTNCTSEKVLTGNVVDVLAKDIYPGEVTIKDGKITSIKRIDGEYDTYILPGFVDAHIHIESTLMTPENYARMAVENGVVAAICDPHEITNVLGIEGIDYMIDNSKKARFHFNFMLPSCVPSTNHETAGATIDAQQTAQLIAREDIIGLAEMMNAPGVIYEDAEVMAKIQATHNVGKPIDGHAPKVTGEDLRKYVAAGISTDHECSSVEEAKEKLDLGMKIIIREGSAACNFESLYPIIGEYPEMTLFCSDDMYPDDITEIGYINGLVRRSVAKNLPLWNVLQTACTTPVKHYSLKSGLLQEGDPADFIVVNNLQDFQIQSTYINGYEVYNAKNGVTDALQTKYESSTTFNLNKFEAKQITTDALQVKCEGKKMKVITATEGSLITGVEIVEPKSDATGNVITDVENGIAKLVVYNRYAIADEIVPQVAYIKGFDLQKGALASTIAHDSHNIIALGCNDEDIVHLINLLIEEKGGVAVCDGQVTKCLPLPIAGLMTTLLPDQVSEKHTELKNLAASMGCTINAPFMTLAFMALPVIPDLKLTDKYLFDGITFCQTPLWAD